MKRLDAPEALAFLPMLYVAWADGDLETGEIEAICNAVAEAGNHCGDALEGWLDPNRPPTAEALQDLLATIRERADSLEAPERLSILDLSLELARAHGRQPEPQEVSALKRLGSALAVPERRILPRIRPTLEATEPEPAFDVAALQRLLDGKHHAQKDEVRELLRGPEFRYRYGLSKEDYREQVKDWLLAIAETGWGALGYPKDGGGREDLGGFIAVFETLASFDLSLLVKFGVQFGLFGGSIAWLGSEEHRKVLLPRVATGKLLGCFAMSETGHGSNVQDIETIASYDDDSGELIVSTPSDAARKDYIGNAACHGTMATVFAQLAVDGRDHGVHAVLVPIRDQNGDTLPGVEIEDCGEKMGLNGVDNGRLWFHHVRVPKENLLDRFATITDDGRYESPIPSPTKRFFTMLGTLVGGRVSVGAAGLTASKSALTIALRYALQRRQFGPDGEAEIRLIDYLTHCQRLLPRLARSYALSFALHELVDLYVERDETNIRMVEAYAAGMKALCSRHATDTIQECREACGGQGYLTENRFAHLKADSDIFTTFEGDNTVLLQLVAKDLLTGYRRHFEDLGAFGLARLVVGEALESLLEGHPLTSESTDREHLRSKEFQLAVLHFRKDRLLATVARRLRSRIEDGQSSFEAFVECQDHLIDVATSWLEHRILERFAKAVDSIEDETMRDVLDRLRALHGLSVIRKDAAWFLEHHTIAGDKSEAIRAEINHLLDELRHHALPLVNAFGIPREVLGAPIAFARKP